MSKSREGLFYKIFLILASVLIYIFFLVFFHHLWGGAVNILALFPVIVCALLFGHWGGLLSALLFLPLTILVLMAIEGPAWPALVKTPGMILGTISMILIGMTIGVMRDLNVKLRRETIARKRAEVFQGSEDSFRLLFENMPEGAVIVDVFGNVMSINPALEKMVKLPRQEFEGKNIVQLMPRFKLNLSEMLKTFKDRSSGKSFTQEFTLEVNGGKKILVQANSALIRKEGKPFALAFFMRDITQSRQAEQNLRESEERYHTIFDSASNGLLRIDSSGTLTDINRTIEEITGVKKEDYLGKKLHTLSRLFPAASLATMLKHFAERMLGKEIPPYSVQMKHPDNSLLDVEIDAKTIKKGKKIIGEIVIVRDVTTRKQAQEALRESEEKYRAVFEQAADSIVLIDPETGELVMFNDRACKNLGYTRDEFKKLKIPDFEIIESPEEVKQHIDKIIKEGIDAFETKHGTKDGKIRNMLVNSKVVSVGGKRFIQSIWRDITERKQTEEKIEKLLNETRAANEQLKQMDKTKDEFLSVVTHDLKSPLVPIEGYADLLSGGMAGEMSDKQIRFIHTIKRQAKKMRSMIDGILDYTRVEFGKVKLNAEKFSLNELVIEGVEEIKPDADYKKMKIELDLPSDDLMVSADRGKIGRVMANLLTNAVKYTPEQGKISVTLSKQGKEIRFVVEDNGIGIAKADLARVFDKFYMVAEKGSREKRSLGLGLHIAKNFIEAHKGKFWAESKGEGKGSKFSFTLPLA